MPTISAMEKPRRASPPSSASAMTVSSVVPEVMIVRDSVSLTAASMTSCGEALRIDRKRSRTRSNTTTVSFRE